MLSWFQSKPAIPTPPARIETPREAQEARRDVARDGRGERDRNRGQDRRDGRRDERRGDGRDHRGGRGERGRNRRPAPGRTTSA
jgi:ribonuclease G